jgi:hypothetical protein
MKGESHSFLAPLIRGFFRGKSFPEADINEMKEHNDHIDIVEYWGYDLAHKTFFQWGNENEN